MTQAHTTAVVEYGHSRTAWLMANTAMKLAAVTVAVLPLLAPDLPGFEGKFMELRALSLPIFALIVPVLWWTRARSEPYPYVFDLLVTSPYVVDLGSNALFLYDGIGGYDLLVHFTGTLTLVTAFGVAISGQNIGRLNAAALCVGFGATAHVLWEIGEYGVMQMGAFGLELTYANTIHDLIFSFVGTMVGAAIVVIWLWDRPQLGATVRTMLIGRESGP